MTSKTGQKWRRDPTPASQIVILDHFLTKVVSFLTSFVKSWPLFQKVVKTWSTFCKKRFSFLQKVDQVLNHFLKKWFKNCKTFWDTPKWVKLIIFAHFGVSRRRRRRRCRRCRRRRRRRREPPNPALFEKDAGFGGCYRRRYPPQNVLRNTQLRFSKTRFGVGSNYSNPFSRYKWITVITTHPNSCFWETQLAFLKNRNWGG